MVLNSPFTKTLYIDLPSLPFWSSLRAIWGAASQAAVLILPQIKLNSQLSSCTSVLSHHKLSVKYSLSVVSDSLRPHRLQKARLPCPSPTPGAYSNSYPLSQGCHPTISYSVVPFSSHLQSFPASGSFQMSQFFVQVVKVLEFQLQHQSFQWVFRTNFL